MSAPRTRGQTAKLAAKMALLVLAALLIRMYVFMFFSVRGPSMQDTLHTHQILAASKLHYRLNQPRRGDIVICRYPDSKEYYVKRVIGLAGEVLEIRDGRTYINGQPLQEEYVAHQDVDGNFGPIFIGDEEVFIMGDNRPSSADSRVIGTLPYSMLVGRVFAIVLPFGENQWVRNPDYEGEAV